MAVTCKLVAVTEDEVDSRIILLYFEHSWTKTFQLSFSHCPGQCHDWLSHSMCHRNEEMGICQEKNLTETYTLCCLYLQCAYSKHMTSLQLSSEYRLIVHTTENRKVTQIEEPVSWVWWRIYLPYCRCIRCRMCTFHDRRRPVRNHMCVRERTGRRHCRCELKWGQSWLHLL